MIAVSLHDCVSCSQTGDTYYKQCHILSSPCGVISFGQYPIYHHHPLHLTLRSDAPLDESKKCHHTGICRTSRCDQKQKATPIDDSDTLVKMITAELPTTSNSRSITRVLKIPLNRFVLPVITQGWVIFGDMLKPDSSLSGYQ